MKILIAFIIGVMVGTAGVIVITPGDIFKAGFAVYEVGRTVIDDMVCEDSLRSMQEEIAAKLKELEEVETTTP